MFVRGPAPSTTGHRAGVASRCPHSHAAGNESETSIVLLAIEDITDPQASRGDPGGRAASDTGSRWTVANDVIFNVDVSGRFTFVNPTACLLTKYQPDELVGRHFLTMIRR